MTFVILARLLTPEDFGLIALGSAIVMVITLLFDLSLPQYLIQQVELERRVIDTSFWSALALGLVAALVVGTSAPLVADLLNEPELVPVLVALGCTVPVAALSAVPESLLRRTLAFDVLAKRSMIGIVASGAVGVALALAGAGVWALVAQTYTQVVVSVLVFYGVAGWRPGFSWDRRESGKMVKYGVSLWGMSGLHVLRQQGDELVVGAMLGSTHLGVYSVAKRIVLFVSDLFGGVVLQVVPAVLAAAKTDPERVRRGYLTAIGVSSAMIAPVAMGLAAVSGALVPAVFGSHWQSAGAIAQVAALGAAVTVVMQFDRGLFLALDMPTVELRNLAVGALLMLGAAAIASRWELIGVVIATTAANYVTWAWRVSVIRRRAGIPAHRVLATVTPVWVAALLASAVAWVSMFVVASKMSDMFAIVLAALIVCLSYPVLLRWMAHATIDEIRAVIPARLRRHLVSRLLVRYLVGRSGEQSR